MIKKVFRPFWSYDVNKTEEFLSSMVEKGFCLMKMNRWTRCFFFQQGEPKKLIYRIGYDKMQGESLPQSLLVDGWTKVLRSGNWYVTANEKPLEQMKTSSVRDGIIKHNRTIMYIFGGIFIYLTMILLFNLIISLDVNIQDEPVEVVYSPLWIVTYIFFGIGVLTWALSIYSILKINKSNKILTNENKKRIELYQMDDEKRLTRGEEKQLRCLGELVVKRKFAWMYAPDKLEMWLESMEEKGYNLYRVSKPGTTFYFLIGRSRKISYCADYQNIADESYFDIHRDSGWLCAFNSFSSLQKWTIWSREYSEGEERPQIYSDKSNHLKHAKRIAIAYSCLFLPIIVMYIFNLGLSIEIAFRNRMDNLSMMNMVMFSILILIFGSFTIRTWLYYRRLTKQYHYHL